MKRILLIFSLCSMLFIMGCGTSSTKQTWTCIDVTSYDHNWNNDMKCTSSKGVVQYTSYEGAKILMGK